MSQAPIFDRVRLIPRPADFLSRNTGASGEIFYNKATSSLRVYNGNDVGGYEIARADLNNISNEDFLAKASAAGLGAADIPETILDLGISDGTNGQVLSTDGEGNFTFVTVTGSGVGATTLLELTDTPNEFGTTGQVLTVNDAGDGVEFTDIGVIANQNAFSSFLVSGQNTIEADSITDTITLAAGSGISITTDDTTDTITFSSTVSSGSTTFDQLTDATPSGLTIDKVYEPAMVMLRVDNNGTSSYTFNSHYTGDNPTIHFLSGTTVAFDLDAIPGHPFEIQDGTGTAITTGLVHVDSSGNVSTDTDAQGKSSGTLYWRIPESLSAANYRYQCQVHPAMFGIISIRRLSFA